MKNGLPAICSVSFLIEVPGLRCGLHGPRRGHRRAYTKNTMRSRVESDNDVRRTRAND